MDCLVIQATEAMTDPLEDTPSLPNLVADLLLDYNAERIAAADGSDVVVWNNSDGSWGSKVNLVIASSNRPKFAANGVSSGHASVRFTTSPATSLRTNPAIAVDPRINTPISVAGVVKFNSTPPASGSENIFSGRTGDAGGYVYARRGASGRISMGGGAIEQMFSAVAVPVGSFFFFACIFDGPKSKLFIEKVKAEGETSSAFWDGVSLGANAVGASNMNGDIAEIKAYSRALSDTEVLLLRQVMLTSRELPV
jgi:hypothetical protein